MINFENVYVAVDNTGILAQQASISQSNSLGQVNQVGRIGTVDEVANGPKQTNFRISYLMDVTSEPCYEVLRNIKNMLNDSVFKKTQLAVANISGEGYLTEYSFSASPNQPIAVSVNFSCYNEISGNLEEKRTGNTFNSNPSIGHSWGFVTETIDGYKEDPVNSFNYNFSCRWIPVYIVGQQTPKQVLFDGGIESISLIRDFFTGINYSGDNSEGVLLKETSDGNHVRIKDLNFNCSLGYLDSLESSENEKVFNLENSKIVFSELSVSLDEPALTKFDIIKHY